MNRRIAGYGLASVAILLTVFVVTLASNREEGESRYRGIPDGAAGLLARYCAAGKTGGAFRSSGSILSRSIWRPCITTASWYCRHPGRFPG